MLAGLCIGVVNMAPDDVYRVVLPALGIELLVGNISTSTWRVRLALKGGATTSRCAAVRAERPHVPS